MVVLLFFLSNNLFFFHLLGNFLYVVCCILWETIADDVILDFLCAYLAHHIVKNSPYAENGGYPPTQNGDIRSLFWLFSLMALQN